MKIAFHCLDNDAYRLIFYQQQTGGIAAGQGLAEIHMTALGCAAVCLVQEKIS